MRIVQRTNRIVIELFSICSSSLSLSLCFSLLLSLFITSLYQSLSPLLLSCLPFSSLFSPLTSLRTNGEKICTTDSGVYDSVYSCRNRNFHSWKRSLIAATDENSSSTSSNRERTLESWSAIERRKKCLVCFDRSWFCLLIPFRLSSSTSSWVTGSGSSSSEENPFKRKRKEE